MEVNMVDQIRVSDTLRRIRRVIGNAVRTYQVSNQCNERELRECLQNIERISIFLSEETQTNLSTTLRHLLMLPTTAGALTYRTNIIHTGGVFYSFHYCILLIFPFYR